LFYHAFVVCRNIVKIEAPVLEGHSCQAPVAHSSVAYSWEGAPLKDPRRSLISTRPSLPPLDLTSLDFIINQYKQPTDKQTIISVLDIASSPSPDAQSESGMRMDRGCLFLID